MRRGKGASNIRGDPASGRIMCNQNDVRKFVRKRKRRASETMFISSPEKEPVAENQGGRQIYSRSPRKTPFTTVKRPGSKTASMPKSKGKGGDKEKLARGKRYEGRSAKKKKGSQAQEEGESLCRKRSRKETLSVLSYL